MSGKGFKKFSWLQMFIFSFLIGFGSASALFADEADEKKSGNNPPRVGGTIQMIGVAERLDSDARQDTRIYLFEKQARLNVSGKVSDVDYYVSIMFGSEEVPKSSGGTVQNTVLSLLDSYFDIPIITSSLNLRIGQFKVPYSREMLSDSNTLQFALAPSNAARWPPADSPHTPIFSVSIFHFCAWARI